MNALLKRLDEAGSTGADMSPGDPLAKEAATAIRELRQGLDWAMDLLAGATYNDACVGARILKKYSDEENQKV